MILENTENERSGEGKRTTEQRIVLSNVPETSSGDVKRKPIRPGELLP